MPDEGRLTPVQAAHVILAATLSLADGHVLEPRSRELTVDALTVVTAVVA